MMQEELVRCYDRALALISRRSLTAMFSVSISVSTRACHMRNAPFVRAKAGFDSQTESQMRAKQLEFFC